MKQQSDGAEIMNTDGIEFLGIDRVLKRGSGEIIAETDHALLVRDSVSEALMLGCEDAAAGLALLDRHGGSGCGLLMVSDHAAGLAAFERYGFSEKLECYQVAYYGEKPAADSSLTVRTADESDLPVLTGTYHLISPEEMEKVVRRGSVLLGYEGDRLVGFIGEHLEGSMGLLYVFPAYRRRGYGTALQTHYIVKTMESGFVPFGQVEKYNRNSLNLQRKIGMTRSDSLIVWMWRGH